MNKLGGKVKLKIIVYSRGDDKENDEYTYDNYEDMYTDLINLRGMNRNSAIQVKRNIGDIEWQNHGYFKPVS